jgi:hypothetical protein
MSPIIRSWIAMLLGVVALVMAPAQADARGKKHLFGTLSTEAVACDTFCTEGPLTGGLAGTLEWTMDTMTETANPDVVTFVGVNTVTTAHGTLVGTDYGIWNVATGEFIDFTVFSHGTGAYAGKRGTLLIIGEFDAASGTGHSSYTAVVF